jgi:hypothetical protein
MKKKVAFILIWVILAGSTVSAAPSSLVITKAEWSGALQRLVIWAKEAAGNQTLTVLYSDVSYNMRYDKRNRRYFLTLAPICYNDSVAVASTSGASITGTVKDPEAMGSSSPCGDPHANLSYTQYPANCLSCHHDKAEEVSLSTHYQWLGDAPDMVNGVGLKQGKLTNSVNSYCINILGNWKGCGACHVGKGKRPDDASADLSNIDCLVCHNAEYAVGRKRLTDGSMGVEAPSDSMVRNVAKPERTNCLVCHANAGGGDGVKRGDLSMALISNSNPAFDVHMNAAAGDLNCQACHTFEKHRVIGKGSDLRATDDLNRGSRIDCSKCHAGQDTLNGHDDKNINSHVQRVACQTCHIPTYAKVPTETHRNWQFHADGSPADGNSGPGHPFMVKESSLIPEYKFWNGKSNNVLLGDNASKAYDSAFGTYPTSRPVGDINDPESKLYPFKYKTALQPKTIGDDRLIAMDTYEYLKTSGDVSLAVRKGLENMGYPANEPYEWITTDTYQLINHGVNPAMEADASGPLSCNDCHNNTERMDLQGEMGYALKASSTTLCIQCHERKETKPFEVLHVKHVRDKRYDCSWCHNFSRPEKGLRMP